MYQWSQQESRVNDQICFVTAWSRAGRRTPAGDKSLKQGMHGQGFRDFDVRTASASYYRVPRAFYLPAMACTSWVATLVKTRHSFFTDPGRDQLNVLMHYYELYYLVYDSPQWLFPLPQVPFQMLSGPLFLFWTVPLLSSRSHLCMVLPPSVSIILPQLK